MNAKYIHIGLAVLFTLFTMLQYDHPDLLLWILIYGSVALISVLKIYLPQVNFKKLIITLMVIFVLYGLAYIPSLLAWNSESNLADQNRIIIELGSLFIALGAMIYLIRSKIENHPS